MKKLAIIGSGDLGQQIAHHAIESDQFKVVGFFDDFKTTTEQVMGLPILGGTADILSVFQAGGFDELLIGIGYKHLAVKAKLYERFKDKIPFAKLIHRSCHIDSTAVIAEGCVIFPGCIIDQHAELHPNVLLNIGCSISHHTHIGAHSFLSPCVTIAGFVTVNTQCIIGINATLIDNINLCERIQIGGGGVVITDLNQPGLYVGNPVRFIR